jgi:hypothetical protein
MCSDESYGVCIVFVLTRNLNNESAWEKVGLLRRKERKSIIAAEIEFQFRPLETQICYLS